MNLYPAFLRDGRGDCAVSPYPDDWTADGTRKGDRVRRERAVAICQGCPFREACKEWAIKADVEGIYGGTTPSFRRRLRAHRAARAVQTAA